MQKLTNIAKRLYETPEVEVELLEIEGSACMNISTVNTVDFDNPEYYTEEEQTDITWN